MLRKRNRSLGKDLQMSHLTMSDSAAESYFNSDNKKNISCFRIPGLFVGLTPTGLSDADSVWSPTSPLDLRVFSNPGNPVRSPRSPHCGQQKSWDTSKVGLSIIHSLENDTKVSSNVLCSEKKNILFGPQMRIKTSNSQIHSNSFDAPKSLPKNYTMFPYTQIKSFLQKGNSDVFEIGETPLEQEPFGKIRCCSLDSCRSLPALANFADRSSNETSGSFSLKKSVSERSSPPLMIGGSPNSNNFSHIKVNPTSVSNGSGNEFTETLSADEIELSEDYTRVISHGPNPRTIHIYGDCILDCHTNYLSNFCKGEAKGIEGVMSSTTSYPSDHFLSFCYNCNKKLEGKDIYIYRGEKGFCSVECRFHEILIDEEEMLKDMKSSASSSSPDDCKELFETGIFVTS